MREPGDADDQGDQRHEEHQHDGRGREPVGEVTFEHTQPDRRREHPDQPVLVKNQIADDGARGDQHADRVDDQHLDQPRALGRDIDDRAFAHSASGKSIMTIGCAL